MMKSVFTFIALCVLLVNAKKCSTEQKRTKECLCANTKEFNPVCASDNKTYSNPGEVRCANKCNGTNLKIQFTGECPCLCANTFEYAPVCASNGRTYVNLGAIRCHNKCNSYAIKLDFAGPCREGDVPLQY